MKEEIFGDPVFEEYKQLFFDYLDSRGLSKTVERFAILREVYEVKGHFNVEMLYSKLKQKKYQVSKATFYHTLNLMLDCHLIQQQSFSKTSVVYERTYGIKPHNHIIISETDEVIEFYDDRIDELIDRKSVV